MPNFHSQSNPIEILNKALKYPIILDFSEKSPFVQFSCQKGCQKCCGYTYFLPKELLKLPNRLKSKIYQSKEGMFEVIKNNRRCIFYNTEKDLFCSIHNYRPLRCRIYPYFPLIVESRIIITMEPALKMKDHQNARKNCPGIGKKKKQLKKSINECISFLINLQDTPQLLETIILTGEAFSKIRDDRWFIRGFETSNYRSDKI